MLKQLVEKIRLWRQNIRVKLPNKHNLSQNQQNNKPNINRPNINKTLIGVSVGFILGAVGSALILNSKLEKVQKEYKNTKFMLSSKLKSCQRLSQNYVQSITNQSNVISAINAIPSSNIFASFYAKLIKEQQQKQKPQHQNAHVSAQHHHTPQSQLAPAPQLPPLNAIIGKNPPSGNQADNNLQWIIPSAPPTPQVSVIVCSNNNANCYAVSSDGTVYTNGYVEGNYKLVVTQSQVYWIKIHRKHSEK